MGTPKEKNDQRMNKAIELMRRANHITAFTGAGISVESGIPPFRGENGLWSRFDPVFLDIGYFTANPEQSWKLIKEIFYDSFSGSAPNDAHLALAALEERGLIAAVITQNIDNLHTEAGSNEVIEFHGTSKRLLCTQCGTDYHASEELLATLPPRCARCSGVLKPDFVFFGESIPERAQSRAFAETSEADIFLLIGTTGEIQPASTIPFLAKERGAAIIEINIEESNFTGTITDVFLCGKATSVMRTLYSALAS